ncbi:MAG: hypothetical protein FK733_13600 [Asgard group archaeon]|nr:hypothetical protein [Asgard group archaeon]
MLFNNPISYANIISGAAALIVSFLILIKNYKSGINLLFFVTFLLWGASWILMGFLFLYEHPVIGAQVLRDFAAGSAIMSSFVFFTTAFVLFKGEHYLKKWYVSLPIIISSLISTIIVATFDYVVYDSPDGITDIGEGIKTTQAPWVMIFLYIVPGLMIITSLAYLIKTRIEVEETIIKKRILYFIFGFSSIIFGMLIIGISGVIEQLASLNQAAENAILLVGNGFWFIGPIICFIGFNVGRKLLVKKEEIKNES